MAKKIHCKRIWDKSQDHKEVMSYTYIRGCLFLSSLHECSINLIEEMINETRRCIFWMSLIHLHSNRWQFALSHLQGLRANELANFCVDKANCENIFIIILKRLLNKKSQTQKFHEFVRRVLNNKENKNLREDYPHLLLLKYPTYFRNCVWFCMSLKPYYPPASRGYSYFIIARNQRLGAECCLKKNKEGWQEEVKGLKERLSQMQNYIQKCGEGAQSAKKNE
ncbi:unnamed protein product [Moneuplotes crassus]|uniref:Uncharacterized protein n=1 Tax=Euplotes crassus TaxID=5936 RepID=A0AAD2D398_EUPCR|nr:unnamed protein product [Moneuplotes crassus]